MLLEIFSMFIVCVHAYRCAQPHLMYGKGTTSFLNYSIFCALVECFNGISDTHLQCVLCSPNNSRMTEWINFPFMGIFYCHDVQISKSCLWSVTIPSMEHATQLVAVFLSSLKFYTKTLSFCRIRNRNMSVKTPLLYFETFLSKFTIVHHI